MGVLMALLILGHYNIDDFRRFRKPFLLWTICAGLAGSLAAVWVYLHLYFPLSWLLMILAIFLFGYIAIYTFATVIRRRSFQHLNIPVFLVWSLLMLVMILSRSDYAWPAFYFVMFGLFFLTPYTRQEQEDIFQGALNGLILSFFAFQAFCCVFRPYDDVRYVGIYTNPNIVGLYYLEVLAAVMIKYLYAIKIQSSRWVKAFYGLGLGVLLSFLFMSISRTAWIVAFILCVICLLAINKLRPGKSGKQFVLNGLALMLCACIMFPCTFGIVRYTPPFFHHPVWFWGEWSGNKVHSWDPWNSEKYVNLDELLSNALGRLVKTMEDLRSKNPFVLSAKAAGEELIIKPEKIPVLTRKEDLENGILVRKTIYSHYFHNLNLWGHRQDEQGFQLTRQYWIGHAHNIYLQYGTDFGIIALILFMGLSAWTCVCLLRSFLKKLEIESIGYFLFALIPLSFGLLEYCWGVSSFSILMLFMAWGRIIRKN